jgi:cytochrome oxidase Cu insertion factor (SCO1/SenC/PrrC family)
MSLVAALLVALLTLAAACGDGDGGGEDALISEGAVAPDFSLPAAGGETVSLSDFAAEKNVLLYFSMGSG